jgi:hypothetical protein
VAVLHSDRDPGHACTALRTTRRGRTQQTGISHVIYSYRYERELPGPDRHVDPRRPTPPRPDPERSCGFAGDQSERGGPH